jgi:hypothetical protein
MVLQPGAHGGGVDHHREVVRAQLVGRADPGQQQLRRLHRPGGDDDLAGRAGLLPRPVAAVADPLARSPSSGSRPAEAPVSTVRFGRRMAGRR